ncbi:MAG: PadR family transcriptional regulator [Methanobacterium sp.]|nr:PadR family transcriptional regulator [Methanobacterium sp.]
MSLSYALLGLLTYGPMTGYQLKKVFDESISHVWAASLSQIYRDLSALEKKGYLSSNIEKQEDRPDKKIYTLTEAGKAVFISWLGNFPEKMLTPNRDEFMLRIFFGSRLDHKQVLNQFKRFIVQMEQYLSLLESIEKEFDVCSREFSVESEAKEVLFWQLTIKRGHMTIETLIRWAEDCIYDINNFYAKIEG